MVWSLALRPDDAKQDPVVYGTKFGVVFLAEGPCTASIQKGFDCFGLHHPPIVSVMAVSGAYSAELRQPFVFRCRCNERLDSRVKLRSPPQLKAIGRSA